MVHVLREREFRLLWLGQSASTIGDRLVFVALALYVTEIGSPTDVGLVLAAHAVPFVAFLVLGGVWADRLPRHRVMVVTDVVRALMHAVLAALIFTGAVEIWHIVVIEAVFGAAEAFFRPAYTGLVPQTVPEPHAAGGQRGHLVGHDGRRVRRAGAGHRARARRRRGLGVRVRRRHVRDLGPVPDPAAAAPARRASRSRAR